MSIVLHFEAQFDSVFSINGVFIENPDNIRYEDNQALYITVYPLRAMHLPYTVKLIGGRVASNKELCTSYALPRDNYYIRLKPRLNYVYSPVDRAIVIDNVSSAVNRFFTLIKSGDIAGARQMMTQALSSTISDTDIAEFFDTFVDILPNTFYDDSSRDTYFLVDKTGKCDLYRFVMVEGGLIDNIKFEEASVA